MTNNMSKFKMHQTVYVEGCHEYKELKFGCLLLESDWCIILCGNSFMKVPTDIVSAIPSNDKKKQLVDLKNKYKYLADVATLNALFYQMQKDGDLAEAKGVSL